MASLKGAEKLFLKTDANDESVEIFSDEARREIEQLVKSLLGDEYEIHILRRIVEGRSGSLVFLVETSHKTAAQKKISSCYLKLHRDADEQRAFQKLMEDELELLKEMPRIISYKADHKRLAVLSEAAFGAVDKQHIVPLTTLIKQGNPELQQYITSTLDWLGKNFQHSRNTSMTLYKLLRCALERSVTDYDGAKALSACDQTTRSVFEKDSVSERYGSFGVNVMRASRRYANYPEDLRTTPSMLFGKKVLPNPIYYLQNPAAWTSDVEYDVPVGETHGDLHADNIICNRTPSGNKTPILQIIDPGKVCGEQLLFFDYAYLEFNVIRLQIRRDAPEQEFLEEAQALIEHYSTRIQPGVNRQITNHLDRVQDCVQTIRKRVKELIGEGTSAERSFWVAMVATGLNFARKRVVSDGDRTLAMLYAAYGLRRLSELGELGEVDQAWDQAESAVASYWLNMRKESTDTADPAMAINQIAEYIRGGKTILFVCTSDENSIQETPLREELHKRIEWLHIEEKRKPQSGTKALQKSYTKVSEMLRDYREHTSSTNVRWLIQYLLENKELTEAHPLTIQLGRFGSFSNTYFATTGWSRRLERELERYVVPGEEGTGINRVFRLCGSLDHPNTICWQDELTRSPLRSDPQFNRMLDQDYVVLLGRQPWTNSDWNEVIGTPLKEKNAQTRHVWFVDETIPPEASKIPTMSHIRMGYRDFLDKLLDALSPAEAHTSALSAPEQTGVFHALIDEILSSQDDNLWLLLGEPGSAKTWLLEQLVTEHKRRYTAGRVVSEARQAMRFAGVIDLGQEQKFMVSHMALIFLVFDVFHRHLPPPAECILDGDYEVELSTRFMRDSDRFAKDIPPLLAFDNFSPAHVDNRLATWLRKMFWSPFKDRGGKIIYTMRFPHPHLPKTPMWKFSENLVVRSMPRMNVKEVYDLVKAVWSESVNEEQLQALAQEYHHWAGGHVKTIYALYNKDKDALKYGKNGGSPPSPEEREERKRQIAIEIRREVVRRIAESWGQGSQAGMPSQDDLLTYTVPFYLRRFSMLFIEAIYDFVMKTANIELNHLIFQEMIGYLAEHGYIYQDDAFEDTYFIAPSLHRLQFDIILTEIKMNLLGQEPTIEFLMQIHQMTEQMLDHVVKQFEHTANTPEARYRERRKVANLLIDATHYHSAIHNLKGQIHNRPSRTYVPDLDFSAYDEDQDVYFKRWYQAILDAKITSSHDDEFDSLLEQ